MFNLKTTPFKAKALYSAFCLSLAVVVSPLTAATVTADNVIAEPQQERRGHKHRAYKRKSVELSAYFTEANLKFNAVTNPKGIFTSADDDTTTYSDAVARQQLLEICDNNERSRMSYLEAGNPNGDPMILIHGTPTQAFLWRKMLPLLPQDARIIAVDLIGYGRSSKHDMDYTFKQHSAYLTAFIEKLKLDEKPITFVMHDIGSVPGLAYAARNPEKVRGVALFEALYGPVPSFAVMPDAAKYFRSAEGTTAIYEENAFVEQMLFSPSTSDHDFTRKEQRIYRRPFLKEEDRDVLAGVVSQVPVMGGAPDGLGDTNIELLGMNAQYLMTNTTPRLFMYADPGFIMDETEAQGIIQAFNPEGSMTVIPVGHAEHFWPEDIPVELSSYISDWYNSIL